MQTREKRTEFKALVALMFEKTNIKYYYLFGNNFSLESINFSLLDLYFKRRLFQKSSWLLFKRN